MSTPIQHDFRSDTVTRPSPAMRAAMASAEVGDDVYRDDPTVTKLEAVMAELFGKEAAVFLTSGTQSNLVALMAHCERGDEYIVGQQAHCYRWEAGGAAVLGSIQPQPLNNQPDGSLLLADIEDAIKPDDSHYARTRLLASRTGRHQPPATREPPPRFLSTLTGDLGIFPRRQISCHGLCRSSACLFILNCRPDLRF